MKENKNLLDPTSLTHTQTLINCCYSPPPPRQTNETRMWFNQFPLTSARNRRAVFGCKALFQPSPKIISHVSSL